MNNVRYCECCDREFCYDCRLKDFRTNPAHDCLGCKALLFDRIVVENVSLRQRVEELENQEEA